MASTQHVNVLFPTCNNTSKQPLKQKIQNIDLKVVFERVTCFYIPRFRVATFNHPSWSIDQKLSHFNFLPVSTLSCPLLLHFGFKTPICSPRIKSFLSYTIPHVSPTVQIPTSSTSCGTSPWDPLASSYPATQCGFHPFVPHKSATTTRLQTRPQILLFRASRDPPHLPTIPR
jgi:hypothetical protein